VVRPPPRRYAGVPRTINKNIYDEQGYTPLDKMKPETINPFEIYLDLDCVTHIKEAINKWEVTL
jgi:hypothetical protein